MNDNTPEILQPGILDKATAQLGYLKMVGIAIGFIGGAYYANSKNSGYLGYAGYIFLFCLAGLAVSSAAELTMKKIKA